MFAQNIKYPCGGTSCPYQPYHVANSFPPLSGTCHFKGFWLSCCTLACLWRARGEPPSHKSLTCSWQIIPVDPRAPCYVQLLFVTFQDHQGLLWVHIYSHCLIHAHTFTSQTWQSSPQYDSLVDNLIFMSPVQRTRTVTECRVILHQSYLWLSFGLWCMPIRTIKDISVFVSSKRVWLVLYSVWQFSLIPYVNRILLISSLLNFVIMQLNINHVPWHDLSVVHDFREMPLSAIPNKCAQHIPRDGGTFNACLTATNHQEDH